MITPEEMYWCAVCSEQVYEEAPSAAVEREFVAGDLKAAIFVTNVGRILAYRGTKDIENAFEDAEFEMTQESVGGMVVEVHKGFWEGWRSLGVGSVTVDLVTGHSLGGAMAKVHGIEYRGSYKKLVTFGEPRVGDNNLARMGNQLLDCVRVVNYKDIVPHLPPQEFGYRHSGDLNWFDKNGQLQVYGQLEMARALEAAFPLWSVENHKIANYVALVKGVYNASKTLKQ